MNSKKIAKIGVALMVIATILLAVNMVFASVEIPKASTAGYTGTGLDTATSNVLGIISYICYAAAVIMLVVLGVKFIAAAPDAKADIKKQAIVYVIGAVLVFAAGGILTIIRNVATSSIKQ